MGGPGGRARPRLTSGGAPHLSSALGDSFFFLNKSVIFGGAGTGGNGLVAVGGPANAYGNGNGPAAGVLGSPATRLGVTTPPGGGRSNLAPLRFKESDGSPEGVRQIPSSRRSDDVGGGTQADRKVEGGGETPHAGNTGGRGGGDTAGRAQGAGSGADRPSAGARGAWAGELAAEGGEGEGRPALLLSSAEEEARRAREEEAQQGEIMRLLTCLKTLGDENVSLMKECEDRDKASASTPVWKYRDRSDASVNINMVPILPIRTGVYHRGHSDASVNINMVPV